MRRRKGLRERYGASSLQLLLLLSSFALALYAGVRLLRGDPLGVAIWFVGAALLHDLVLLPLYTLADRAAQALVGGPRTAASRRAGRVPPVNYVRVPVLLSVLLLVVWYPLVLRRVPGYRPATGLDPDVFLGRWLLLSAAFFAVSALCLLVATARRRRRGRASSRARDDSR